MNIEQQVISLEYAKRLKYLNVNQESLFYYADDSIVCSIDMDLLLDTGKVRSMSYINNSWPDQDIAELYSAFTVYELLELLPSMDNSHPQLIRGHLIGEDQLKYCCRYGWEDEQNKLFVDINPANSCAKILIYLIENELINVKD